MDRDSSFYAQVQLLNIAKMPKDKREASQQALKKMLGL